jgi:hypothetical protein
MATFVWVEGLFVVCFAGLLAAIFIFAVVKGRG